MSQTDVNAVLSQMRTMAAQAQNRTPPAAPTGEGDSDFGTLMKNALEKVNDMEQNANNLTTAFERGAPEADLGQVMVAVQKADLSFRAMGEVRNKLVSAYQEIMNMPI